MNFKTPLNMNKYKFSKSFLPVLKKLFSRQCVQWTFGIDNMANDGGKEHKYSTIIFKIQWMLVRICCIEFRQTENVMSVKAIILTSIRTKEKKHSHFNSPSKHACTVELITCISFGSHKRNIRHSFESL